MPTWYIIILPAHVAHAELGNRDFRVGLNENANSYFFTLYVQLLEQIAVSPVTAVHKEFG